MPYFKKIYSYVCKFSLCVCFLTIIILFQKIVFVFNANSLEYIEQNKIFVWHSYRAWYFDKKMSFFIIENVNLFLKFVLSLILYRLCRKKKTNFEKNMVWFETVQNKFHFSTRVAIHFHKHVVLHPVFIFLHYYSVLTPSNFYDIAY